MRVTASDLVRAIDRLPKDRSYNYINPDTTTKIRVVEITPPEGPITITRYDPNKGQGIDDGTNTSMSSASLWRLANNFVQNLPLNIDRVFGASFNYRSALESLLAHTPEFYYCYPGRIEVTESSSEIKAGHKHLLWDPSNPHENGVIRRIDDDLVVSEMPKNEIVYEQLMVPGPSEGEIDIDIQRRHAQIQLALLMIGKQLGSRVSIAQNDKNIQYKDQRIGEMEGVIPQLRSERLLAGYQEAVSIANLIDVIWFRDFRFMPAVFEIEHSTGVVSGLSRMKNFQDKIPPISTRWVIVAPDEDRNKVVERANREQFRSLNTYYFPYSAVEELYSLCIRREIKDVGDEFLECFMEPCIS